MQEKMKEDRVGEERKAGRKMKQHSNERLIDWLTSSLLTSIRYKSVHLFLRKMDGNRSMEKSDHTAVLPDIY